MNMNWRQRAGQFMLQLLPSARIAYATAASENAKKRVDKVTEEIVRFIRFTRDRRSESNRMIDVLTVLGSDQQNISTVHPQ